MMEKIRTAANSIVIKIIFGIIILCFIFTGVGFFGFGTSSHQKNDAQLYVAKVDGVGIERSKFEAQTRKKMEESFGIDASFVQQYVLMELIDNYLAYLFSQKIHAAISNEYVKNTIRQQKIFFSNGKFDHQKYLNLLAKSNLTPDSYAEGLKASLQRQQVMDALITTDFVLPSSSEISLLKNQKRTIYATLIDSSIDDMKDINITEEDEKKYYDEHQKEFFRKERVKLKFIYSSKANIAKTIRVTDDEVKAEYEKNIKNYSYPAKKAFSVIFAADKKQADEIMNDLSSGANFKNIAEDLNKNNNVSAYGKNGSLGWFVDDNSLPEFLKKANLNKVNKISNPIPTDDGFIIVKLDDNKPAKRMNFDFARILIFEKLSQQQLQKKFNAVENKIKDALAQSPKSIEELAEKTGFDVETTDWTSYRDLSTIMINPEVSDLVFSEEMIVDGQPTHKISDIIPVEKSFGSYDYVLQVTDYRPEGLAPFDEVREIINKKLYKDIAENRFKTTVADLLTELKSKGKSDKVDFSRRYVLNRNSTDLDKKVVNMVFDLEPPIPGIKPNSFGAALLENNTAYIVVLVGVDTPKESQDISAELLQSSIIDTNYYLSNIMSSKSKIEIMPALNM
jgi:parvulin-like peptidyl-prolyl isomerase